MNISIPIEEQIEDIKIAIMLCESSAINNEICLQSNRAMLSKLLLIQAKMADLTVKGLVQSRDQAQSVATDMITLYALH